MHHTVRTLLALVAALLVMSGCGAGQTTEAAPAVDVATTEPATVATDMPATTDVPTTTGAPSTPMESGYPETAPSTTTPPPAYPTPAEPGEVDLTPRELVAIRFVEALNAADLATLEALAVTDPRADATSLGFLIDHAPFVFESCFTIRDEYVNCNAISEDFGLSLGFASGSIDITSVDGAFNDGL